MITHNALSFIQQSHSRYEDRYGSWLQFFKQVAENPQVVITECPRCWAPFLFYLGATIQSEIRHFSEDRWVAAGVYKTAFSIGRLREYVEVCSAMRPELVDALYKADMEWKSQIGAWRHTKQKQFQVTCNGSFFRPEVLNYLDVLTSRLKYDPLIKGAVFVPCAADKPYPSPVHTAVMNLLNPFEEIVIVTGVCGVVPKSLWPVMPHYDSGLPNELRVTQWVQNICLKRQYKYVVSYCDFYNPAIKEGFEKVHFEHSYFVHRCERYIPYQNLLSASSIERLKSKLRIARDECP